MSTLCLRTVKLKEQLGKAKGTSAITLSLDTASQPFGCAILEGFPARVIRKP
jgi:hypothetical protein